MLITVVQDQLLRKENLDLKLTPYRVLAISAKHGYMQFVEAMGRSELRGSTAKVKEK